MAQSYAVNTVNSKSNIRAALTQEKAKEKKKIQRRIQKSREGERKKNKVQPEAKIMPGEENTQRHQQWH